MNFLSDGKGWDCFLLTNILPKLSKITVTCTKSVKSQKKDYQFGTAQYQQNEQFENLYNTSHGEARNIKLRQQGKPHSKGSTGYSASEGI